MYLPNLRIPALYMGAAMRAGKPYEELVRGGDPFGIIVKCDTEGGPPLFNTDRMRGRIAVAALTGVSICYDFAVRGVKPDSRRLFFPLSMNLRRLGEPSIDGADDYERKLRRSPHIEIHFSGTHRDIPRLPGALLRAAEFLERKGTGKSYPYVVGITNTDMARFANLHGMRSHRLRYPPSDQAEVQQLLYDAYRAARGKPPRLIEYRAVSLPTEKFIELGRNFAA